MSRTSSRLAFKRPGILVDNAIPAGGLNVEIHDGKLTITSEGKHRKFIQSVEQITFSGRYSQQRGQKVLHVAERAVFELTVQGVTLTEVAPESIRGAMCFPIWDSSP